MTRTKRALHVIAFLVIGVIAGILGDRALTTVRIPIFLPTDTSEPASNYHFINPLLFCRDQDISQYTNALPQKIERDVGSYIESEKKNGDVVDVAMYFKDLSDGPWAAINPDLHSIPASLLKVPTAIGAYRQAEQNPAFLDTKVTFGGGLDTNERQYFQPYERIVPNTSYTREELIQYMLEDSDNNALALLSKNLDEKDLENTFSDLGIDVPDIPAPGYVMTARTYASFFRVLYNASYLNQQDSEHLLSLLSQSKFHNGLEAGLPKSITIAHKFGEYTTSDGRKQLHDCGIVYKPHQPYILCVMTHGDNFDTLAKIISTISNKVYGILENQ